MQRGSRYYRALALFAILIGTSLSSSGARATGAADAAVAPQEAHRPPVEVTVVARKYAFEPARIEVDQDDIVKITLRTEDIPHSFNVDKYRIAKRAAPGQPVTFEFRADQAGRFVYYCNLTSDERCKEMKGELVVNARR